MAESDQTGYEELPQRNQEAPYPDKEASKTADPTEMIRAHLRAGWPQDTDGLDDYNADYSSPAPAGESVPRPSTRPTGKPGNRSQLEEAEESRQEPLPTEHKDPAQSAQLQAQTAPGEIILSRGRTLVVGEDKALLREVADNLAGKLDCLLLLTGAVAEGSGNLERVGPHSLVCCPQVRIWGSLGAFTAKTPESGGFRDVVELARGKQEPFDLVLDLTKHGVFTEARPLLGYFWANQAETRQRALHELPRMRGRFEKQHFIFLHPENCAHGHAGKSGCSLCIRSCPYGVLGTGKEAPRVDHLACQGCLACASVCPTGALEPLLPRRGDLLERMEEALAGSGQSEEPPLLVLHWQESEPGPGMEGLGNREVVPVPVEAPGALGTECLLAALAMGASGVVVPEEGPAVKVLDSQVQWARTILQAMGLSPERVQICAADSVPEQPPLSRPVAAMGVETFSGLDKRGILSRTVRHLIGQGGGDEEVLEVPRNDAFGRIAIQSQRCTLCMACAGACPSGALEPGGEEQPGLRFTESRCVQCGLCARICPESALSLWPRLSLKSLSEDSHVWLHRESPERCSVCGRPFASSGMLEKVGSKLREQRGEDPDWLRMCGDCRVRTLFQ